jgi:hypothetical protein
MNATYTNSNSPRFNFLILIAVMLLLLTVSKKCAAQIPVDKDVLNYLFSQSAKAYYLDKDITLCDSINAYQKEILTSKDSIIIGQSERLTIEKSKNEICNLELITANAENKKANRKVKFFKFTTVAACIGGFTSTLYLLFR